MKAADQNATRRAKATKPAVRGETTVWQADQPEAAATTPTDNGLGPVSKPATRVREW